MIKGVLNMKKSIKQKIIVLMAVSAMALSACAKSDTSTPDSSRQKQRTQPPMRQILMQRTKKSLFPYLWI